MPVSALFIDGTLTGTKERETAFLEPRYHPELLRIPNSLIEPVSSLITCSNSLQALKNFPVQMRRELAFKALINMPILAHFKRH